jgi:hypothetical protein
VVVVAPVVVVAVVAAELAGGAVDELREELQADSDTTASAEVAQARWRMVIGTRDGIRERRRIGS